MRASLAFLSVVASAIAQGLQVNTPASATLCQPTAITYSGGTAPYYLTVLPGGMVGATPLISFPTSATLTAGTYTWLVNIAAGTSITLQVKDSTGTPAYSSPITIGANTDSSCLTATTPSAGGAATGATTGAATSAAGTSAASSPASSAAGTTAVAAGTSSPAVAATTSSRVATGAASTTPAAAASSKPASAGTTAVSMLALFGAAVVAIAA